GFEYTTTFSTVNFFGSSSVLYEGCVSTYAGSSSPTTVPARVNDSDLTTTAVSGQITMWGQPITVEYEASDLSLFTTSTSSSTTSTSSSSTGTSSSTSSATQAPGTTSGPTIIATSTSNGLSSGAIAGIVVAALVIAILLAIIAFLLLRRKRRAQAEPNYQGVPTQNPGTSNQPYQPYQPEPMVQRSPVEAPGDSQRPGELPGEFYSPGKNRISGRMIGELPG
ncbi:hypothetical protein MMC19_000937, partial [Ptychographa xylographoides]|nr:hypothetical protein [Ptychographa xylographoides]